MTIVGNGGEGFRKELRRVALATKDPANYMAAVGRHMMVTEVPTIFNESGPPGGRWPPVRRGGRPLIDTGRLRASISYVATKDDVSIGSSLKYAKAHQLGLKIAPKKGKFLTIPLSPPLSASQVRTARARDFKDLFFVISKKGNYLLAKKGVAGGIVPYFLLVRSVKLQKRPFLVWTNRALAEAARLSFLHVAGLLPVVARRGGSFDRGR